MGSFPGLKLGGWTVGPGLDRWRWGFPCPELSLFAGSRDYLICGVKVSPCSSLSCWGVYALESIGFNS